MRSFDSPPMTEEEFELLNEVISESFGIVFPEHKKEILQSRLTPRLAALHMTRFMDYYLALQIDMGEEMENLARVVTNNETYFFRETDQFYDLFGETLSVLKATAMIPGKLRFLCAGCSSGEEPHTLSIFRRDHRALLGNAQLEIEGFDIDPDRLEMALNGDYGFNSLRALDEEQQSLYFDDKGSGVYQLKEIYRDGVRFSAGNILEKETFQRPVAYDVVFCRNVLIYFSEAALHRAIDNFASVLRPGGLLFLGHSESIIGLSSFFETVRLERCIAYKRVIP